MTYNRVSPLKHCLVCFAPTQVPHLTSSRQLSFSEHIIRDSYSHTASSHCVLSSIRLISTRQPNKLPARLTSCCKRAQPYHPSLSLCKLVKATNHSIALRVHISNKSRRHKKGKTSILSCPRKKKLYTREKPTKPRSHRCLEVPAIATLWSRASTVCHRRCFFRYLETFSRQTPLSAAVY